MKSWILIFVSLFTLNVFAEDTSLNCEQALTVTPFGVLEHGLTYRGFLGQNPPVSAKTELEAIKHHVMLWGLKIYAVNSEKEASQIHDKQLNRNLTQEQIAELGDAHYIDPPMAPIFILTQDDPNSYLKYISYPVEDRPKINDFFHQLAAQTQVFYYNLEGQKIILTPEEIAKLQNVFYFMNNEKDHFFYLTGWFAPKFKGVESIDRFMLSSKGDGKPSNSYKNLMRLLKKYYKEGLRITFNRAMDDVLILAGTQARIGRTNKVSKKDDIEKNPRFNKAGRQGYLDLLKTNNAYSVEVWDGDPDDPNTRLLGGTFGKMVGSVLKVDSLAYVAMKKVRIFDKEKRPLFNLGEGLLLPEVEARIKSLELIEKARASGVSEEKINENISYYTPKPAYTWEDPKKDQTGPNGVVEYLRDENGEILEIPRGEFADLANLALYQVLKAQGIDITDVGMVTPKSYSLFKARYIPLEEAIQSFKEQQEAFGDREITFPLPNEIYRPEGFSDVEFAEIMGNPK